MSVHTHTHTHTQVHLDSGTPLSSLVKDPVSPIATVSPHDLASLLKQYLRELATPLIPNDMAAILCACEDMDVRMVEGGEGRREVKGGGKRLVLLACVLLPAVHLQVSYTTHTHTFSLSLSLFLHKHTCSIILFLQTHSLILIHTHTHTGLEDGSETTLLSGKRGD